MVELGQTSRHILVHFEKISTKIILSDVFLGDISFYLVLEFLSSFSSRSYPPVRKCTNYCGMNMTINMALKTRTRCYWFDKSVRKCDGHRAQTQRKTTSYILLQRGFTETPARCWAALYGVGCLSIRAANAVFPCFQLAPPLGMFVSCFGTRRDHNGRRRRH